MEEGGFKLAHNKRHSSEMGADEVWAFLMHLVKNHNVAASTRNQALNAIVFMDREVLHRDPGEFSEFQKAKRPMRLPPVLTRDEVQRVLAHLDGTYGLMARLLYGSGLRLMGCVRLRIKDIGFTRGTIMVRSGKGDKDRMTVLLEALREQMQAHIERLKGLYTEDREQNLAGVELSHGFAVKFPNGSIVWAWQWVVFPDRDVSRDPRSGIGRRQSSLYAGVSSQAPSLAPDAGRTVLAGLGSAAVLGRIAFRDCV
ncbi:MAG: hypothetical protein KatS3mg114_0453 [Planctomycetaceae bacterium]|nr:MAG: hypothetical protein KatS3mg114_0453 [Planctomycetaceae bacterium]